LIDLTVDTHLELVVTEGLHPLGQRQLAGHPFLEDLVGDARASHPVELGRAVGDLRERIHREIGRALVAAGAHDRVALVLVPVVADRDGPGAGQSAVDGPAGDGILRGAEVDERLIVRRAAGLLQVPPDGADVLLLR